MKTILAIGILVAMLAIPFAVAAPGGSGGTPNANSEGSPAGFLLKIGGELMDLVIPG